MTLRGTDFKRGLILMPLLLLAGAFAYDGNLMRDAGYAGARLFDPEYAAAQWHGERHESPNYSSRGGARVRYIIIDAAAAGGEAAFTWASLSRSAVSVHYVIDRDGKCYQLVPEEKAAWQTDVSSWRGETGLNASAIGIELDNNGHELFTVAQMQELVRLIQDIRTRYAIDPADILGHSDVAPLRADSPGALFNWGYLAQQGLGLWPDVEYNPQSPLLMKPGDIGGNVVHLQAQLARFGYGLAVTGNYDEPTQAAVTAFQQHFRPPSVTGQWDGDCQKRLDSLLALSGRSFQTTQR